jgi:phage baseplate assembly protein W
MPYLYASMTTEYHQIEARIEEAVAYQSELSQSLKITVLATTFGVPYQRLRRRLQGSESRSTRSPTNMRLSNDEEEVLLTYLRRCERLGVHARVQAVTISANSLLRRSHVGTEPAPRVTSNWTSRFLKRHPTFKKRRQIPQEAIRAAAYDLEDIGSWFTRLGTLLQEHSIQPEDCWNMDETGFRIGIGKGHYILTEHPERAHALPMASNRESLTVVEAINAAGSAAPAMLVIAAKTHQAAWFESLHDDTLVGVADTGYMNDELMLAWIAHFERHSACHQRGLWRLLLLDGYGSHHTLEFITYCEGHRIIPFGLPSHSTHFLQPLDVVVFQPYKHWHAEAVDRSARLGCSDYNKLEFFSDFEWFRRQALSPSTIKSAFEKTGIWPFNPTPIIELVRTRIATIRQPQTPSPPSAEHSSGLATPRTVRTLKRRFAAVFDSALDEALRTRLAPILRGAVIQALEGAEAIDELQFTTVAQAASRNRSLQKRTQLQRGGVLTAANARSMVRTREDDEIEKARKVIQRADDAEYKQRCNKVISLIQPVLWRPLYKQYRTKFTPQWLRVTDELRANR